MSEIVTDTSVKQALEEGEERRGTGKAVGEVAARLYKMDKQQTETQNKKPGVCETVFFLMCLINLSSSYYSYLILTITIMCKSSWLRDKHCEHFRSLFRPSAHHTSSELLTRCLPWPRKKSVPWTVRTFGSLTPGLCVCMTTWRLTANGKLPYNNLLPCRVFNWIEHRFFAGDWVSVEVPPSQRCYLKEAECQRGLSCKKSEGVSGDASWELVSSFFLAKFNGDLA